MMNDHSLVLEPENKILGSKNPRNRDFQSLVAKYINWTLVIGYWSLFLCLSAYAFDPLTIAQGATALGMGGAAVAAVREGNTVFNNPASLGEIDSFRMNSMSGTIMEEATFSLLDGVYPFGSQAAFGIGYSGVCVPGIERYDSGGISLGKAANYTNGVFLAAYGKKLTESFSLGLSVKYNYVEASEDASGNGSAWNADLGLMQKSLDWVNFGLVGKDLFSSTKIIAGTNLYLMGSRFSSAIVSPYELSLALDLSLGLSQTNSSGTRLGIEFSPSNLLTVRTGLDQNNPTAGVSLKTAGLGFHYAYHTYGGFSGNVTHYFSLSFDEQGWPPESPPETRVAKK
ncbi:MAG: hypothetical protein ABIH50_03970 [bacterium]